MLNRKQVDLVKIDIAQFFDHGMIIEHPVDHKIFVGIIDTSATNSVHEAFTINFYGTMQGYSFSRYAICTRDELLSWCENFSHLFLELQEIANSDHDYKHDVQTCLDLFHKHKGLKKMVPVSYVEYNLLKGHPIACLKKLSKLNGYLYGMWQDSKGVIGVTPEQLLLKDNDEYNTVSLAGTVSTRNKNFQNSLLNDPKIIEEQELVTLDIHTKLKPITTNISILPVEIYNYGPFAHLKTKINFQSSLEFKDLCLSLTPTAALGGYPSKVALQHMQGLRYFKLQKENRFFGGVIALDLEQWKFSLVAIRNIEWESDKLLIHSGTGVVFDSKVEAELAEIQIKRKSIQDCLG